MNVVKSASLERRRQHRQPPLRKGTIFIPPGTVLTDQEDGQWDG